MAGFSRRGFLRGGLALAGLGLLAGCAVPPPGTQPPTRVHRVGVLHLGTDRFPPLDAFRRGLHDLGYAEGRDLLIETRASPSRSDMVGLAAELVDLKVDVILAAGPGTAFAARHATRQVPIVFAEEPDPVGNPSFPGQRLVESLARPGGNVTGLSTLTGSLAAKRVELLKEAAPSVARVLLLTSGQSSTQRHIVVSESGIVAHRLGLRSQALVVHAAGELDVVLERGARGGGGGLIVVGDSLVRDHLGRVVELAARHGLPAIYDDRSFADAGGLLAYGPNVDALYRRAAVYVDKILKGADPAELPIEQPTTFDFVINLKAARLLGLGMPQSVLAQATEVIP